MELLCGALQFLFKFLLWWYIALVIDVCLCFLSPVARCLKPTQTSDLSYLCK
jgi:hypothetical protein